MIPPDKWNMKSQKKLNHRQITQTRKLTTGCPHDNTWKVHKPYDYDIGKSVKGRKSDNKNQLEIVKVQGKPFESALETILA